MRLIGNILWLVLGGLAIAFGWAVVGVILCITIIGIPVGKQAFKMAKLTLTPFGTQVVYGGGAGSAILNFIWVIILCITIIGIPVGKQAFKMAKLTLTPFGTQVVYGGGAGSAILNFIWVNFVGQWFAIGYFVAGVANCITSIGIPFGLQSFKKAKLALFPFGTQIV